MVQGRKQVVKREQKTAMQKGLKKEVRSGQRATRRVMR